MKISGAGEMINVHQGRNASAMRRENRGLTLSLLHYHGTLSRRELGHLTGLRASTITYIANELLAAGLIRDVGRRNEPRRDGPGRRTTGLTVVADGACAVGIQVGIRSIQVGLVDLAGTIHERVAVEVAASTPAAEVVDRIVQAARYLIERFDSMPRVLGAGVGVVGWVDPIAGIVRDAPHRGWRDVPIADWLRKALGVPVQVENNVRAMAVAEQWLGHGTGSESLILVTVGTAVGAGIVVRGELVRGHDARAGQIGHLRVVEDGPVCDCGRRGCLNAVASDDAIARRVLAFADANPTSALARYVGDDPRRHPDRAAFAAAADGDDIARTIVGEAATHLGRALAPLVAAFDPERIVAVGAITDLGDLFFGPFRQAIVDGGGSHSIGILPSSIAPTQSAATMPIVGAASLALRQFFVDPDLQVLVQRPEVGAAR